MRRRTVLARGGSLLGLAVAGCLEGDGSEGSDGKSGTDSSDGDDAAGGEFHASGTMEVVVDGTAVDLTADRFQAEYADEDVRFHFHAGDENWHTEEARVTFATAVNLLPRFAYAREGDAHVVTVDGERYDGRDSGTEIAFRVDGEAVDPVEYDVRDGDHLGLEVTTGG